MVDERKLRVIRRLELDLAEFHVDFHEFNGGVQLIPMVIELLQAYYNAHQSLTAEEQEALKDFEL
jgi:hypothetical protein